MKVGEKLYNYTWKPKVSYLANFTTSSHHCVTTKISLPKVGGCALTRDAFCTSKSNLVFVNDERVTPLSHQDTLFAQPASPTFHVHLTSRALHCSPTLHQWVTPPSLHCLPTDRYSYLRPHPKPRQCAYLYAALPKSGCITKSMPSLLLLWLHLYCSLLYIR